MIFKGLLEDARSIRDRDPAARTTLEVVLLYQGFHALFYHRQAHWLYKHKHFFSCACAVAVCAAYDRY